MHTDWLASTDLCRRAQNMGDTVHQNWNQDTTKTENQRNHVKTETKPRNRTVWRPRNTVLILTERHVDTNAKPKANQVKPKNKEGVEEAGLY